MKTLLFIFIMCVSFLGLSQNYNQATKNMRETIFSDEAVLNADDDGLSFFNKMLAEQGYKERIKKLNGSIYQNKNFQIGKISDALYNKRQFTYLRYNIFADAFEIKNSLDAEERIYAVIQQKDVSVKIGDDTFFYRTFKDENGKLIDGYLQSLKIYDDFTVYKRYFQKFDPPVKAPNPNAFGKDAEVDTYINYYIEKDGRYYLLDMNKRRITDSFFENTKDLEKFIKSERLKFKDEADLLKLTDYYAKQK